MSRRWLLAGLLTLLVGIGAGCAPRVSGPVVTLDRSAVSINGKSGLLKTFRTYWALRAKGDADGAFRLEAPYVQDVVFIQKYRNYVHLFHKARLVKVEIYGVDSGKAFFSACLDCRAAYEGKGGREQRDFRDCWVEVDGSWYHVLNNPLIFPQLGDRRS